MSPSPERIGRLRKRLRFGQTQRNATVATEGASLQQRGSLLGWLERGLAAAMDVVVLIIRSIVLGPLTLFHSRPATRLLKRIESGAIAGPYTAIAIGLGLVMFGTSGLGTGLVSGLSTTSKMWPLDWLSSRLANGQLEDEGWMLVMLASLAIALVLQLVALRLVGGQLAQTRRTVWVAYYFLYVVVALLWVLIWDVELLDPFTQRIASGRLGSLDVIFLELVLLLGMPMAFAGGARTLRSLSLPRAWKYVLLCPVVLAGFATGVAYFLFTIASAVALHIPLSSFAYAQLSLGGIAHLAITVSDGTCVNFGEGTRIDCRLVLTNVSLSKMVVYTRDDAMLHIGQPEDLRPPFDSCSNWNDESKECTTTSAVVRAVPSEEVLPSGARAFVDLRFELPDALCRSAVQEVWLAQRDARLEIPVGFARPRFGEEFDYKLAQHESLWWKLPKDMWSLAVKGCGAHPIREMIRRQEAARTGGRP